MQKEALLNITLFLASVSLLLHIVWLAKGLI